MIRVHSILTKDKLWEGCEVLVVLLVGVRVVEVVVERERLVVRERLLRPPKLS